MSDNPQLVFIGTYTDSIHVFELEVRSGALSQVCAVEGPARASYLALSANGRALYATNELVDDGGLSAFRVDPRTAEMQFLNRLHSHGADPAHLSIDPSGRWLLVANYTGGTIDPFQSLVSIGELFGFAQATGIREPGR